MILKVGIFLGICVFFPWTIGKVILNKNNENLRAWIFGWLFSFAVFEVLVLLCYCLNFSANILAILYVCLLLFVVVWGFLSKRLEIDWRRIKGISLKNVNFLTVMVVAFIIIQICIVVCFSHIDDDDAFYVGTATTTYFTNSINRYSVYTGEQTNYKAVGDYLLSPFPVFCGIVARVFLIHPAFLMHTVLPVIWIPMAYAVIWLIGKELFPDNVQKQWVFLGFAALINIFGGFSIRSTSSFLLFRIWQGKAVLCNIMIPLYFYFYIRRKKGDRGKSWYIGLWFLALSSCLVSFSSVMIIPILLGIFLLCELVCKEKLLQIIMIGSTMLPYLLLGLVYAFIIKG